MRLSQQLQYLSTSVANLFWDRLSEKNTLQVFHNLQKVISSVEIYELEFPKKENIWNDIFAFIKQQRKDVL